MLGYHVYNVHHWFYFVLISDEQMKDEMAGTTAVVVILKNQKIYCVRISLVCLINSSHSSDQAIHFLLQTGSDSSDVNLW